MDLVFATQNPNKAKEIAAKLGTEFTITDLKSIGITDEIPETSDTLEGNALQKARYVYEKTKLNCFADDTGLEVEALKGEPGVYSARYAGSQKNANDNMDLLLKNLDGEANRKAQFRTVIALIIDGKKHLFEGTAKGKIIEEKQGTEGFGYDPIFIPDGFDRTFAQMDLEEKNQLSHRAKAFDKMKSFLTYENTTNKK
jgi:XTP/dITP diphosphohydrolase